MSFNVYCDSDRHVEVSIRDLYVVGVSEVGRLVVMGSWVLYRDFTCHRVNCES